MEIAIMFGFIGGIWAAVVAGKKNRNPFGYLVLGFLMPIIGVIVAYCAEELPVPQPALLPAPLPTPHPAPQQGQS